MAKEEKLLEDFAAKIVQLMPFASCMLKAFGFCMNSYALDWGTTKSANNSESYLDYNLKKNRYRRKLLIHINCNFKIVFLYWCYKSRLKD